MDRKTAELLVGHWHGSTLDGERPSDATYSRLARTVRQLIPKPDAFSAVMLEVGGRAVLALHGNSLFIATAWSRDDSNIAVAVTKEPLDPARVTVRMIEHENVVGAPVEHDRSWRFERDGKEFIAIRTVVKRGDIDYDPRPEAFVRQLCAAVGWEHPPE